MLSSAGDQVAHASFVVIRTNEAVGPAASLASTKLKLCAAFFWLDEMQSIWFRHGEIFKALHTGRLYGRHDLKLPDESKMWLQAGSMHAAAGYDRTTSIIANKV